jgi:hypothetical protein
MVMIDRKNLGLNFMLLRNLKGRETTVEPNPLALITR